MAEKAMHKHCLVLGMTYDDSTQRNRDAAAMFQYADVRLFLANLRAAVRKAGGTSGVRFLCAGEQGDRYGRCHWHMILYTSVDPCTLGTVQRLKGGKRVTVTERTDMITVGKKKLRLNWSLWPHGFVTFQEPDQGGMNYVLSYCLKDQFTEEKSHETKRQAKVENFATGLFRMSKRPAIGEGWLWQKFQTLEEKGACLPSLNLKVPGFHGYYQPSGSFRQKLLWSLVALNKRHVWTTGENLPQWSSLLSACNDNQSDLEVLNGPSPELELNYVSPESELAKRQREYTGHKARRQFARTCGNVLPCEACLDAASVASLAAVGVERFYERVGGAFVISYRPASGFGPINERQREKVGRSNPLCQKRGSSLSRHTFPASDRTDLRYVQAKAR